MMNWNVGKRINEDVLLNKRAYYEAPILKHLAQRLRAKYGSAWGYQKLQHCVRVAYTFSEDEIMYAVRTQLSWKHLRSLMEMPNALARQFYMEMCRIEHLSSRA